jgi:antirestriction protein ArdC
MSNAIYTLVTDTILKKLAQGVIPWKRPWDAPMPQNIRGNEYRGINQILLGTAPFKSPFWLTYRQATERGGYIRKGERSSIAVFWKLTEIEDKDPSNESNVKTVPYMRIYKVFNIEQTEGVKLEPRLQKKVERLDGSAATFNPIAKAESIWDGFKGRPRLEHGGSAAYYVPSTDTIHLPHRITFQDAPSYYATLLHEAAHSTAHESRLNRGIDTNHASKSYAYEELTAELTSAFLLAKAGLDPELQADQQAAYIKFWSAKLKDDPKLLATSAARAQKAADFILGTKAEEGADCESEPAEPPIGECA